MFHTEELKRLSPIGVFFAVYSLVFLLWKATFLYSLPFLLGLLIAAALQPVIRWAQDRLHLGRTAASGIITLAALTLLLSGLILMTVLGVRELAEFLTRAASGGGSRSFRRQYRGSSGGLGALSTRSTQNFLNATGNRSWTS